MKTRGMMLLRRVVSICLLVALTAGAVTLARRLGSRPDPHRIEFLRSAGPLEIAARRANAGVEDRAQDAKPPVVAQAEAFALYLSPPEPIKRTPPKPRARAVPVEVVPVAVVSAPMKYRLLGISYHRSKPEESKALVWAADGGPKWVASGAALDSIVVRQINRGSILYQDAAGVHEMTLEMNAATAAPAQKPQDPARPKDDAKIAAFAKMEAPVTHEELPPADVVADVNQPRVETPPERAQIKPQKEPAPPRATPGRRPRPMRSVARQS